MGQILTSIAIILQALVLIHLVKENMEIVEKIYALRNMFNALMRVLINMNEEEYLEFKKRIQKEIAEGKFKVDGVDNER